MRIKGSFTIEASIIFPIIFLTIVAILYLAVYMHDKAVLQSVANEAALEFEYSIYLASDYEVRLDDGLYVYSPDKDGIQNKLDAYVADKTDGKLIFGRGNKSLDVSCKIDNYLFYKEVTIIIIKPFNTKFSFVNHLLSEPNASPQIHAESKAKLYNREEIVRTVDFMDDVTAQIPGVKKLKDGYDEKVEGITELINKFID